VQGAKQVKEQMPNAVTVFIHPPVPAIETLRARIMGRGDVSLESLERRLRTAKEELAQQEFFDYHVINDDLEVAKNAMLWRVRRILSELMPA
jgi:guanylate kinase